MSWQGGWTEGALDTGLNAVAATAKHLGGRLSAGSPLTQHRDRYDFSGK